MSKCTISAPAGPPGKMNKKSSAEAGLFLLQRRTGADQKSMPSMPPMPLACYPEASGLIAASVFSPGARTPLYKEMPVRVSAHREGS